MGWGRTLLLGDIGNRLDIDDVERDVADLKDRIGGVLQTCKTSDERFRALAEDNAELKLYLVAVIRLLTAKGAISREELQSLVHAADLEDGRADGKFDGKIVS
jgi:hypothetical protein